MRSATAFQRELNPAAASSKNQINNHYCQDDTKAAAAIIPNARSHVIPATASQQQENYQNHDQHICFPQEFKLCVQMLDLLAALILCRK
jgi:hypothetical protein